MSSKPNTREELVALVNEIRATAGCRTDLDGMLRNLEQGTGYSDVGMLIFCPPSGRELSAEAVVDEALKLAKEK